MNKQTQLRNPQSCLNRAAHDEPVFVLRAKDPLAAQTVRLWATMAVGTHELGKPDDAMHVAECMDKWRGENCPETASAVSCAPAAARRG